MRETHHPEGPGPLVFRVALDEDELPVGSILIDFYAGREAAAIVLADSRDEDLVRGRFRLYALQQSCELIRRCAQEYERVYRPRGRPRAEEEEI